MCGLRRRPSGCRREEWTALGPPMEVFGFDFHDAAAQLAGAQVELQVRNPRHATAHPSHNPATGHVACSSSSWTHGNL